MAGPCSASWLSGELCSGRRGRPLAPGAGCGSGASASSSWIWTRAGRALGYDYDDAFYLHTCVGRTVESCEAALSGRFG